jgi:hypothetical protein
MQCLLINTIACHQSLPLTWCWGGTHEVADADSGMFTVVNAEHGFGPTPA